MIKARQQRILSQLEQVGVCTYQELADILGVSTMTARREVDELNGRGLIIKTLGGVQRADAPAYLLESAVHARMSRNRREKQAIAQAAIELVEGAQTLFLDGSTTCLELAKLIARRLRGVTAVTNSALTAMELGRNRNGTVIGLGGELDSNSCCFVGATTEDEAERYYVDLAFISTMGFLPSEGTFESTVANFRVKQVIARQANSVVLLVDHSKFDQRALAKVLDIKQIHCVVTDSGTPDRYLHQLADAQIRVLRATDRDWRDDGARPAARLRNWLFRELEHRFAVWRCRRSRSAAIASHHRLQWRVPEPRQPHRRRAHFALRRLGQGSRRGRRSALWIHIQ
jgi:DeoR/GlpR family transcriptional regulator of sugar metabolism